MKMDYSDKLKIFLEKYSSSHDLDLSFSCKKIKNQYIIQSKNTKTNEVTYNTIDGFLVNDLIEKSDMYAEVKICSVIFKTGPKKTL